MSITRKKLPPPDPNNKIIKAYVEAVKNGLKSQHVVFTSNGWVVRSDAMNKTTESFSTENEAYEYALKIAKETHADVFRHGEDGYIKERVKA